jgi:hypothetical protein
MIATIKQVSSPDLWYSECVGLKFNVFLLGDNNNLVFADWMLPILKSDTELTFENEEQSKEDN